MPRVSGLLIFKARMFLYGCLQGSKGFAAVRALASHQFGPGSNPGVDAMRGLRCYLSSPLLREVFLRFFRFSLLLKNQHFQIPIRSRTHEHVKTSCKDFFKCFVGKQITKQITKITIKCKIGAVYENISSLMKKQDGLCRRNVMKFLLSKIVDKSRTTKLQFLQ